MARLRTISAWCVFCVILALGPGCTTQERKGASSDGPSANASNVKAAAPAPPVTLRDPEALRKWLETTDNGRAFYLPTPGRRLELEKAGDTVTMREVTSDDETRNVRDLIADMEKERKEGPLKQCRSNLMNIGTALEMYSTDNSGRFPRVLFALAPNYLKTIPTCPAAGKDTYAAHYEFASNPDAYTFMCKGSNHALSGQAADFPQYTSTQGIIMGQ